MQKNNLFRCLHPFQKTPKTKTDRNHKINYKKYLFSFFILLLSSTTATATTTKNILYKPKPQKPTPKQNPKNKNIY